MTEQEKEIKRVISYIRSCREAGIDTTITIDKSRNHFILNAFEEVQKYRAIGTVKEIQELKEISFSGIELAGIAVRMMRLKEYEAIGTVEECREAREKLRAKKPIKTDTEGYRYTDTYKCPSCGGNFGGTGIADYCYHCGQKLSWEEFDGI